MLLSWANKQLERLAETVAPISSNDPPNRFLSCLSNGDEQGAFALLTHSDPNVPPLDPRCQLNPAKGLQPIHAASKYLAIDLVRHLITQCNISPDTFDNEGNTALHHAATGYSPNGHRPPSELVKILVSEYNASVVVKNARGQTPYDASSDTMVRQFLLPLQLQQETQQCLDAGGKGLPPGIDLGGCRVTNAPLPPPPPIMGNGMNMTQAVPAYQSEMTSVPINGHMPPPMINSPPMVTYPPMMNAAPSQSSHDQPPNNNSNNIPGSSINAPPMVPMTSSYPHPPSSAPPAMTRPIKADGFHSSASDVNLQKKYGHIPNAPPSDPLPPPPSFAGMAAAPHTTGAPAARALPPTRYLAYDAVTDQATSVPERKFSNQMGLGAPPVVGFSVFNPGAANGK